MKEILDKRGFRGLFRGFCVTFNRDFISGGVYFLVYYICKQISFEQLNPENAFHSIITFGLSGGIAGGISWLVTHPLDTIKTIIQMGDLKENTLRQKDVMDKLCQNGYFKGIFSSYRGGFPSVLCYILGCSTFFIVYEIMKVELKKESKIVSIDT